MKLPKSAEQHKILRQNKKRFVYDEWVKPRLSSTLRGTEQYNEYANVHRWVRRTLGRATHCANDPSHESKIFHWSNISREYKFEASDWWPLCPKCHCKFDGISDAQREIHRRCALGNTNRNRPVIRMDGQKNISYYYESAKTACLELGILRSAVNNCLKGHSKSAGGYQWQYASKRRVMN